MKIAIIGGGVVGQGMYKLLEKRFDVIIFDPAKYSTTKEEANACDLAIICVPTNMLEDGSCDTSIVES